MALPTFDANWFPDFRGQMYDRTLETVTVASSPDTAGDVAASLNGTNNLWSYGLGWRRLTDAQSEAMDVAFQIMAETEALYWLEWEYDVATNLVIGTGTGTGSLLFALKCRLKDDDVTAAGLVVTRNFTPVPYTLTTENGANYRQHLVTIAAGQNVNGTTYRATWTAARRRRRVRLQGRYNGQDDGPAKLWAARADFIEHEAGG